MPKGGIWYNLHVSADCVPAAWPEPSWVFLWAQGNKRDSAMKKVLAMLGVAMFASLLSAGDSDDWYFSGYEIKWGGQYGEPGSGFTDEPGCCICFSDVTYWTSVHVDGYADVTISEYGCGAPYTIYRDGVAIATGVTSYGLAGSMWFTDYDVVPGRSYVYEIKVRKADIVTDYSGDEEYSTGPMSVRCEFIFKPEYSPELDSGEVVFGENGGERAIAVQIYRQTATDYVPEELVTFGDQYSDSEWLEVLPYVPHEAEWWNKFVVISVGENATGEVREGVVTVCYSGFRWPIKVRQTAKGGQISAKPWTATKAVTLAGAVYDSDGCVAGVVQLKVAKPGKGKTKVSGGITLMDGKKKSLKATSADVPPETPIEVLADVKDLGALDVKINDDGFSGTVGGYTIRTAAVGGDWAKDDSVVKVDFGAGAPLPEGVMEYLLPVDEPVLPTKAGKWAFRKAASIKMKKGVVTGDADPAKPNLSAMKLTYTPKTGAFSGSFKVYAGQGGKLKTYTAKVKGFVVDGVGRGEARLATASAPWTVTVK